MSAKEVPLARVTLQTIADEVGVSRMTVSNAFSRPDQLSAPLRNRILATAAKLGYAGPDPSGRALARGKTGVIGMLLTESPLDAFRDEVAVGFVRATTAALADAGYSLALLNASAADIVPARDVAMDGVIVYSCTPQNENVQHLLRRNLPIVMVEDFPIAGTATVSIDDRSGAAAAARHLLDLGHRDIVIATLGLDHSGGVLDEAPQTYYVSVNNRLQGWITELVAAGVRPRVVGTPDSDLDDILRARISDLLDHPPSAVLAFSDLVAVDVIEQAQAKGLDVPHDLSVVGFDDNPIAERVRPALTTVRQDLERKGELAVSAIFAQIDGAEPTTPQPIPPELIVRGSTAALNS